MANPLVRYLGRFDRLKTRERALVAITLLAALGAGWWIYHVEPHNLRLAALDQQNRAIAESNRKTRSLIDEIHERVAGGVHREKQAELARLMERLDQLEGELRSKTVELIPPEKMFALMGQLIQRDARVTLRRLARREVRSAIPVADTDRQDDEPGIYRHVMEIELSGSYLDILAYLRTLEALDWRLLWDELEITNDEYPRVDLRLVMSTLSTERQWVGI